MGAETSVDSLIASNANYGAWPINYFGRVAAATTAATVDSGKRSNNKCRAVITVPTLASGVSGVFFPYCNAVTDDATTVVVAALETSLCTLTVANPVVFTAGSVMPTFKGFQTASEMVMAVVTTTCTGWTTPTLTITYTGQDGNGSQTATVILPSNPVIDTAFCIDPHLANGDNGVRTITNITSSATGTAGVLNFFGLRVVGQSSVCAGNVAEGPSYNLHKPRPIWYAVAADQIGVYRMNIATAGEVNLYMEGLAA